MDRRVGIYVRISAAREGDTLGVDRQEADARRLCADRGWAVAEVFCDNSESAYDRRKVRPRYAAMLDAIRDRRIDTIVCWHQDRLHRQLRELVPFVDLITEHGVTVHTVTAGQYDLSTPAGQMQAAIIGSVAEYESAHKSERIRRKLEANAAAGRHHGGLRPFGWSADRVTADPAEAAAVREAADMVLAGESIKSVARCLNAAGHTTATGKAWRDLNARAMLLRPRNAGLRVHRGEVVGTGRWEPILPADVYHQVVAVLADPRRRTTPGRDGRVHLLSGLARCGQCDGPMIVARQKPYKGVSKPIYRCRRGCVGRDQWGVDTTVKLAVLKTIRDHAAELLVEPGRADAVQVAAGLVAELEDRLTGAAQAYAGGAITLAQLTTINAAVRPQLDEAQTVAASPNRGRVLGELVNADDPEPVWEAMTPQRRRAAVDLLFDVVILPSRRGPVFRPESVRITRK